MKKQDDKPAANQYENTSAATPKPVLRSALVTGASRGIGRAIAQALAEEGYRLYLTCHRSEKELTDLSNHLSEAYNIVCTPIIADMGDMHAVNDVFAQIDDLTLLVNNAGISHIGLLHEMTVEEWQTLMNVNLNALFYTCRLAIPMMLRHHAGKIVNISSVWGNTGASMEVAYSASKGGVNAFTKALARELAPSGIQVNAIACGVIDTDMNRCFSEEERSEIPADRFGQVSEVASLLLSIVNAPTYLTGQVITLDGGWQT